MKDLKIGQYIKNVWDKLGFNVFLIIGFLGFLMAFAGESKPKKGPDNVFSTDKYIEKLQNNLTEIISCIDGAGKVKILVTLESGQETIYAMQEKISDTTNQKSSYENEVVIIANGSEKQALETKTLEPVVQGVIVACQGADDIRVVSDITNAVSVALNVTTNRVCVIKMN